MKFTKEDIKQILEKGLTVDKVEKQFELLKSGIPFVNLVRAATIKDGICNFNEEERNDAVKFYESRKDSLKIVKFIPASGAATRMFKVLTQFLNDYNPNHESINAYINKKKVKELTVFLVGLEKLPFFEEVVTKLHKIIPNFNELPYDKQRFEFIKTMLAPDRLNYSFYPKGLIPFHRYSDHTTTAFEEHLHEAAKYASANKVANLHYTVSKKHQYKFDEEFKHIEEDVEEKTNTKFNISFSVQMDSTDTIAVSEDNEPMRDEEYKLVFRPSGHGALIENLNAIDADLIFIKNIDNVVVAKYLNEVAYYKKVLAGVLLKLRDKVFEYEDLLDYKVTTDQIEEIEAFLKDQLNVVFDTGFAGLSNHEKIVILKNRLHRPIRVCGMVRNEGEPGGGPFWIIDQKGETSLQIVESAQIDKNNLAQKQILSNATHFNPVDLVCSVKDAKGEKFDLKRYIDHNTAFITMKTKTGKNVKALERPGLWNGSMAYWNTVFVEVPLLTFNPVKTVNDLLKAAHQIK